MSLVFNPCMPYLGQFPYGFRPGTTLTVQGVVPLKSEGVMMMNGPHPHRSDVSLSVAFGFDKEGTGVIMRTSRKEMVWDPNDVLPIPIRQGDAFELSLVCDPCNILMMVNDKMFKRYAHRLPYNDLDFLGISGNVQIVSISTNTGLLAATGCPCFFLGAWTNCCDKDGNPTTDPVAVDKQAGNRAYNKYGDKPSTSFLEDQQQLQQQQQQRLKDLQQQTQLGPK